jgi:hypothetical protein
VLDGQHARLTQASLETLAIVAYKQPVSRGRVSAIRGVNVDGVMRTLVTRGLVEEAGADTESQATLYRTTSYFLERMGMQSLDDLPELAPYLPEMDDIEDEVTPSAPPPGDLGDETPSAQSPDGATSDRSADEAPGDLGDRTLSDQSADEAPGDQSVEAPSDQSDQSARGRPDESAEMADSDESAPRQDGTQAGAADDAEGSRAIHG